MSMCVITRDRTKEKKGVAGEEPQMGHPERGAHGREHHLGKWTDWKSESQKDKSQNASSSNMQDHLHMVQLHSLMNINVQAVKIR